MTAESLYDGFLALLIGFTLTIVLFFGVALSGEIILHTFEDLNVAFNIDSKWNGYDGVKGMYNLMYVSVIMPLLIGLVMFVLSPVKKQTYDVYREHEEREFR